MLDTLKTLHSFGLHDGEVFYAKEDTVVYEYSADSLKVKNSGTDEGFGIRVLKDRRIGFSYANSKSKSADAIRNAIAFSKFSTPSGFTFASKQKYGNLEAYDSAVAEASETDLKDMVEALADGVKKHSEPVRVVLVSQKTEAAVANTDLLFAKEKSTGMMVYAEAKNGAGFGFADHSDYRAPKDPYELGMRAGMMAKEMKSPGKLASGRYDVIFSTETLSSLFDLLDHSFSGELARRRISRLWDKQGAKLFDERLTISDDPLADAEGLSQFDGEGVASRKTPLIEKGAVKDFYYSRETAALAGLDKEGNCSRGGYNAPPSIGGSNTVISSGDCDPEKELKKYVYIESMHGLHTANTTSGDFGAEVSIAFLHEKGEKKAVRGFMVSENIFNLFNRIDCLGKTQEKSGSFISPKIAFKDVSLVS